MQYLPLRGASGVDIHEVLEASSATESRVLGSGTGRVASGFFSSKGLLLVGYK